MALALSGVGAVGRPSRVQDTGRAAAAPLLASAGGAGWQFADDLWWDATGARPLAAGLLPIDSWTQAFTGWGKAIDAEHQTTSYEHWVPASVAFAVTLAIFFCCTG